MTNGHQAAVVRSTSREDLGDPISVHPPASWLRTLDKFSDQERVVPWILAGLFVVVGGVLLQQYLGGAWGRGGPAIAMPIGGVVSFALAIASAAYGWRAAQKPLKTVDRPTYSFCAHGLRVESPERAAETLLWTDVKELLAPAATGKSFRLVAEDGRQIDLNQAIEDWGRLIQSIIARVTAEKVPDALTALDAGKTLTFRSFGIRKDGLNYNERQINWTEVKSLGIVRPPRNEPIDGSPKRRPVSLVFH